MTVTPKPAAVAALIAVLWGCAPAATLEAPTRPDGAGRSERAGLDLVRSGSLRQDQVSIRLAAGPLRIEVTPLDPWVLEATAPDTRERLTRIADTHRPGLADRGGDGDPTMVLVSFSSDQPDAEFQPDEVHLISRGLRERPLAIQAITPGWGSYRLAQRTTAMAVFAFPGGLDLTRELTVAYRDVEDTSSWASAISRIEAERARIPNWPL